jgi:hypothetical protein
MTSKHRGTYPYPIAPDKKGHWVVIPQDLVKKFPAKDGNAVFGRGHSHRGRYNWYLFTQLAEQYAWHKACELCLPKVKVWTDFKDFLSDQGYLNRLRAIEATHGGSFPTMRGLKEMRLCEPCFDVMARNLIYGGRGVQKAW